MKLAVRFAWACCAVVASLLPALPARAYRNPERFAAPVEEGGGAGKYFTLSRAEGYGCAVCHSQGTSVPVEILNLPTTGYVAGQLYHLTVDWPDDMPSVALNVELTDYAGAPLGQILAADPLTLSAADLCRESESLSAGQTVIADANGRQVLLIAECGQAQTSFDWIAPAVPTKGYFSTSIVFGNRDGKLAGDRVVDIAQPLLAQGAVVETPPAANIYSSCSVVCVQTSRARILVVMLCFCLWMLTQRLQRRRAKR